MKFLFFNENCFVSMENKITNKINKIIGGKFLNGMKFINFQ